MPTPITFDSTVRNAAFVYLDAVTDHGDRPVTWAQLMAFTLDDIRIPLASQQGIFRPKGLTYPISIRTAPPSSSRVAPYQDAITPDGFLDYSYRGIDRDHHENRWLRSAMDNAVPLIYLLGLAKGLYNVEGAAILDDQPAELSFRLALFPVDSVVAGMGASWTDLGAASRRHYLAVVKRRVGQAVFRSVVMTAYRTQCAVCRLRHDELLDAAHIVPDHAGGPLVVTNGVALCKIHHAAYDTNLLGIRPDYVTEVRSNLLTEKDGPMLLHGLQGVHGQPISVPRSPFQRPSVEALEPRYEQFRVA